MSLMQEKRYSIGELQNLTNTNRRTIHFYTQLGLLPRPDNRGSSATYPEEALIRLRLIKELHRRRFKLEEIKEALDRDYEGLKAKLPGELSKESLYDDEIRTKEDLSNYLTSCFSSSFNEFLAFAPQMLSSYEKTSKPYISSKEEEETVRRVYLAEGIELNIKDEIYRRYNRAIKKGILEFRKILSEEGYDK